MTTLPTYGFRVSRPCPACGSIEAEPFAEKSSQHILRCGHCTTLFVADPFEHEYENGYSVETAAPAFLPGRLDQIVAGFASSRQNGRLLDVGFGAGDLLEAARRAGWNVSGVEMSRHAVERARGRGIDAFHGELSCAPLEPESFDVVVASEVLEHVIKVEPLLTAIRRLLRPGGLFWATTPHGRGISARLLAASWSVISPPEHVHLFSVAGLRDLLVRSGFTEISIAAEGVNPRELLRGLRGGSMSPPQRIEEGYALNNFFEERSGRRALKRAINRVLSTLRLGDSLKISAQRD